MKGSALNTLFSLIIAQIWHLVERCQNTMTYPILNRLATHCIHPGPLIDHLSRLHHGMTQWTQKHRQNNCFPIFITIICTSWIYFSSFTARPVKEKDNRLGNVHWHKTSLQQGRSLSTHLVNAGVNCVWRNVSWVRTNDHTFENPLAQMLTSAFMKHLANWDWL